jgi:hypothetical protein
MRVVWQDECQAAAREIIPLFDADLIPLLLRVETPEGYWEVVRAEHLGERPRMLHEDAMCRMLAGRMAGDGLWERLATAEAARLAEQVTALEQKGDQPVSLDDARRRLDDLQRFEAYLRTARAAAVLRDGVAIGGPLARMRRWPADGRGSCKTTKGPGRASKAVRFNFAEIEPATSQRQPMPLAQSPVMTRFAFG